MGKHETGYERVERDLYPTPPWPVVALAEHIDFKGRRVWEPAAGTGSLVIALIGLGAQVFTSDIAQEDYPLDALHDFLCPHDPVNLRAYELIITNPPFGKRGKLATAFIEAGLRRLRPGGGLVLLLPADFDSAKTRLRFFGACPLFVAKIVLTKRVTWFERSDGVREAPKENSAWFVWSSSLLRAPRRPLMLYAPGGGCPPTDAWRAAA